MADQADLATLCNYGKLNLRHNHMATVQLPCGYHACWFEHSCVAPAQLLFGLYTGWCGHSPVTTARSPKLPCSCRLHVLQLGAPQGSNQRCSQWLPTSVRAN